MDNRPGIRSSKMARAFRDSFNGLMSAVGTSVPGRILSFDSNTQLADVQVSIMLSTVDGDVAHPPIISVPVHFSGGNEFHIEHQIDPGDEGIIIFSQRCIDAWVDQGGDATQTIKRQFDMADAMFVPGLRSQPNKISGFDNNGIRLRNKAGDNHIWLKNDGTAEITVSKLVVTGDINHIGNLTQTGNTTTSGTVTTAGKNITVHTHPAGIPPGATGQNT